MATRRRLSHNFHEHNSRPGHKEPKVEARHEHKEGWTMTGMVRSQNQAMMMNHRT